MKPLKFACSLQTSARIAVGAALRICCAFSGSVFSYDWDINAKLCVFSPSSGCSGFGIGIWHCWMCRTLDFEIFGPALPPSTIGPSALLRSHLQRSGPQRLDRSALPVVLLLIR
ncbi:unnamed protein product [Amoebophrya sp. A120]|nr:unnamed protein product [Amoebophrya sp. A120]|eukprot:GSA120T00026390001.1